ncbi:Hypothetical predicted protein [Paramuricea clavata]|uniref:Uncharacterized protein n=1 Tax=Paramuricea clavata TaxID=317549 RepID=A0A7D9HAP1_PARCT|nr:Hypothetical predicted protein [Paramuricea clavata]
MFGPASTAMYDSGPDHVYIVNAAKFNVTPVHPRQTSRFQPPDFPMFLSILLVLYPLQMAIPTSWPALIVSLAGLRQFPFPPSQQNPWPKPSSPIGSPDLAFHTRLLQIVENSSKVITAALTNFLSTTCVRITAYQPIANGLMECFHLQLKASLKATNDPSYWSERLPLVLLGIRTAVKAEFGHSVSERVYGTTLCLPGEFFSHSTDHPVLDPAFYVHPLIRYPLIV